MTDQHDVIQRALARVAGSVAAEPLSYFSETGLQSIVEWELGMCDEFSRPLPTSIPRGKGAATRYSIPRLQREYGGGAGTRVDIAILDTAGVEAINSPQLVVSDDGGADYVRMSAAIEVGTEKSADIPAHARGDLQKLAERVESGKADRGYILHVQRSLATAPTGTGRQLKTHDRLDSQVREPFLEIMKVKPDRIHVLAMILHTGRDQAGMRGKCEMLLPDEAGWSWKKVNVSRPDEIHAAALAALRH